MDTVLNLTGFLHNTIVKHLLDAIPHYRDDDVAVFGYSTEYDRKAAGYISQLLSQSQGTHDRKIFSNYLGELLERQNNVKFQHILFMEAQLPQELLTRLTWYKILNVVSVKGGNIGAGSIVRVLNGPPMLAVRCRPPEVYVMAVDGEKPEPSTYFVECCYWKDGVLHELVIENVHLYKLVIVDPAGV